MKRIKPTEEDRQLAVIIVSHFKSYWWRVFRYANLKEVSENTVARIINRHVRDQVKKAVDRAIENAEYNWKIEEGYLQDEIRTLKRQLESAKNSHSGGVVRWCEKHEKKEERNDEQS